MPIDMHRHYSASPRCDLIFQLIDVHAPGPRIGVDQNRYAAVATNGKGTRDDCKARYDDFIPRFQPQTGHCKFQSDRSVADANSVPSPAIVRPPLLELVDILAS